MHETDDDIARLQALLDASHAAAGPHLADIMSPEYRLDAVGICAKLLGVCILNLGTVTQDGRPRVGPVDGLFYRGEWYFSTGPDAVRIRHIRARPAISGAHQQGEEFGVTVHGTAHEIDIRSPEHSGIRVYYLDTYVPRYGPDWAEFLDANLVLRITAERFFNFWNPED